MMPGRTPLQRVDDFFRDTANQYRIASINVFAPHGL